MQLYWWPKTRSLRALWMLEEVGCPYERVPVNITQGGQKDPAFLAVNPMGKLPALADGEAKLAEIGGDLRLPRRQISRGWPRAAGRRCQAWKIPALAVLRTGLHRARLHAKIRQDRTARKLGGMGLL